MDVVSEATTETAPVVPHVRGASWLENEQCWESRVQVGDEKETRRFSARKFGYEEAHQMAVEWYNETRARLQVETGIIRGVSF